MCDFGLSQVKEHGKMLKDDDLAKGTPLWMAPEVMQFKEFNEKVHSFFFIQHTVFFDSFFGKLSKQKKPNFQLLFFLVSFFAFYF